MAVAPISFGTPQISRDIDFATMGQQLMQSMQQREKRAILDKVAQGGGDPRELIQAGLQTGDIQFANLGQSILNRQQEQQRQAQQDQLQRERYGVEDKFKEQQLGQAAAYQNRSLSLQERQLTEKPTIQKVKDAAGNESLLQVFPDGRTKALTPGEAPTAAGTGPNNPYAPDGKQTEGQANAGLYAGRMFQAEKILRDPKVEAAAQSRIDRGLSALPGTGKMFNLTSNEYQKFDQAQRNFINAVLRRESGAVISDQEFENARQQYFPAPGDTKDRLSQKQANRAEAIRGIAGAAGPAWRAPATFDGSGQLIDRPTGSPSSGAPRTTGPTGPTTQIPPAAIEALRANPNLKADFEAKYGAGTAGAAMR